MVHINDENDINNEVYNIVSNPDQDCFLNIDNQYLKNILFFKLKEYFQSIYRINCHSSENRLWSDLNKSVSADLVIIDNCKSMTDFSKINILNRKIYIY